jgi:hypothetical protein
MIYSPVSPRAYGRRVPINPLSAVPAPGRGRKPAIGFIVVSRPRYEEAFQIIASQLSNIDQIFTNPALVRMGNFSAIYEAARIDDGLEMSFEIRFAIDGDGIWRIEAF